MKNEGDDSKKEAGRGFAEIADTIFAPVYPVIAGQILERTGIRSGRALDAGSGPGHLATAIASRSDLVVHALDCSPDMLGICGRRVAELGLTGRVIPLTGDISSIPLEDRSVDLVISRGSWFFWEDLPRAFSEIHRILKPGGETYIGGGFGSASLKEQVIAGMRSRNPDFQSEITARMASRSPEYLSRVLEEAGITRYSFIDDESGFWVRVMRE